MGRGHAGTEVPDLGSALRGRCLARGGGTGLQRRIRHVAIDIRIEGSVPGIDGAVDLNVAYFGYEEAASAQEEGAAEHVEAGSGSGSDL